MQLDIFFIYKEIFFNRMGKKLLIFQFKVKILFGKLKILERLEALISFIKIKITEVM